MTAEAAFTQAPQPASVRLQAATGTLDAQYTSDGGEVSFKICEGTTPMVTGDTADFVVSKKLGNIAVDSFEIAALTFLNLVYEGVSTTTKSIC